MFSQYCGNTPVPHASQLHGWVDDSLQRGRQAAPGDEYQADIEPLLPVTAGAFFRFYSTADPSTSSTLQRSLGAKANSTTLKAAVRRMQEQSRRGDRFGWAHHKAISATGASDWKTSRPEGPELRLSDVEYAIAARLSLGLQPFPASANCFLFLPRFFAVVISAAGCTVDDLTCTPYWMKLRLVWLLRARRCGC